MDATPVLGARTGVGQFCHELIHALAERDDVALTAFALTWRRRGQLPGQLPGKVGVVRRPLAARPLRGCWKRSSYPPIEWWTGRTDVVHGTNFVVPPARRAGMVVTVHDLTTVRFPELCTDDALEYPNLIRRALRRGALVHTPSAAVAAEVVDHFGVDPDRVTPVAHAVPDVEHLVAGDPVLGRRLCGAERYVLALGTIEPRKDLPLLVRAFDLVADGEPDLHLVVAGPDGWGADAFQRALAASRHGDRIHRLGYVDHAEKAALLSGASVFAYPSVYEGFGLPPLEAMTTGVPVVATAVGSLPEVLGDGACFVPSNDEEALAASLASVLSDEAKRSALVDRGRRWVERYSWSRCAEEMVALYRRAAQACHR